MKKKKREKITFGLDLKRCNECEYRQQTRLCEVDGKICTFHRFAEEVIRVTFALVEYPDGSVGKVDPDKVHFLDRKES
jgi:hypothetical protein